MASAQRTRSKPARLIAVALAVALAVLAAGSALAGSRPTIVGKTKSTPKPVCPTPKNNTNPRRSCAVMGRVSGFQVRADGRTGLFKARGRGHIVAWQVDLSKPSKQEIEYFKTELSKSGDPAARLAVLKKKSGGEYKLVKQSPAVGLKPYYGEKPIFTLETPLRVKKGHIIALTTPTWLPNLGVAGTRRNDVWRASREDGECTQQGDLLKRSRPQQRVGSTRDYACTYRGARLLYWAFLAR